MMAGIRGKDTKPEIFLRHNLHKMGFRYTLGGCGLPGRPDLVFPSRRTVLLVHGCFWHRHNCKYFKWPSSNREFWRKKIEENVARDRAARKNLHKLGWTVIVAWECAFRRTNYRLPNPVVRNIAARLSAAKPIKTAKP